VSTRSGDVVGMVVRPAFSGAMRARRRKKEHETLRARQWLGYIAVAVLTTWLTKKLDDFVDERLA
jgi:hypothetical protein